MQWLGHALCGIFQIDYKSVSLPEGSLKSISLIGLTSNTQHIIDVVRRP